MQFEYDKESAYQTVERALGSLSRMTHADEGVEHATYMLEQAADNADVESLYDGLEDAYRALSRHEQEIEGVPLETPWDVLHLRGAVAALEQELPEDVLNQY